jgi:adenylate cyclase
MKMKESLSKLRIPISVKLIVITILLLVGVTAPIALRSSKFFEDTSRQREESINLDFAAARATEVENILSVLYDKTKTTGLILYKMAGQENVINEDFEINFKRDKNFIALEVLKIDGSSVQTVAKRVKEDVLKTYNLDPSYMTNVRQWQQFPLRNVAQGKLEIQNASYEKGPAMFTIAIPIVTDPVTKKITHIAVADIELAAIQKPFSEIKERTYFVTDKRGVLVAHSDEKKAMARLDMSTSDIVKIATEALTPRGQRPFYEKGSKEKFFGAYAKTSYGVTVFSQISEEIILEPAREVKRRAFFIAGMFLSGALFVVFVFSLMITGPIETLAAFIKEVGAGNLNVSTKGKITSKDEVGELAYAFDDMVVGLRERAKAYAVMRQALGASVIETLMTMKEEELGGMKKPVTVLFSDLRDFTKFSEGHTPEEVVEMLNEYFDVMVKIIVKHGGWLDKFIGDAIMAVWGVPYPAEGDAHRATMAALEMRMGLEELNNKRIAQNLHPLKIGIGLHTGDAIVGKIGATERANLTVIGDSVNQASRIEASTKAFGTDCLISGDLEKVVKDKFIMEYAGAAEVKGKSEPLRLFKLRGYLDAEGKEVRIVTPYSDFHAEGADKVKVVA